MKKNYLLIIALIVIGGLVWYFEKQNPKIIAPGPDSAIHVNSPNKEEKAKMYEPAKELVGVQGFINSPALLGSDQPFKISDYIGKKVILVDFWTYSCINCQRTTPYLNSWWDKYQDKGLLIIGVHTPEFDFEKEYNNVISGTNKLGIKYPVVQDNNYSTWTAYDNHYWPHKYLIDIDGFIVYDHIGEGGYKETEMKIQELLNERMTVLGEEGKISESITQEKAGPSGVASQETYFGSNRNDNFGSGQPGQSGTYTFQQPTSISSSTLYFTGQWQIGGEYSTNLSAGAKIIFKYNSKEVYFVGSSDAGVKIKVLQDGKPPIMSAGDDISKDSNSGGLIKESRLYKLINNSKPGEHTLEIIIENSGLKAFTFTFG